MNEAARRIMPQIDWEAKRLSKAGYVEFLEAIIDGCETRLVAAREEAADELAREGQERGDYGN